MPKSEEEKETQPDFFHEEADSSVFTFRDSDSDPVMYFVVYQGRQTAERAGSDAAADRIAAERKYCRG